MNASELLSTAKVINTTNNHLADAIMVIKAIKPVANLNERQKLLSALCTITKPTIVSFVNAHGFNLACRLPSFARALYRSDVLLKDGVGVSMFTKGLGLESGINMNGTDFIPEITQQFAGKRVAICGTVEPFLSLAAERIRQQGCNVVLILDGFLPKEQYPQLVIEACPDLVIMGMGMPKQEEVSELLAEQAAGQAMLIVNGGAILDFLANRFPRAPYLMRKLRLEWLFRMMLEPRRLWKRYILGGFSFAWRFLELKFSRQF